jgi:hypothetical protein
MEIPRVVVLPILVAVCCVVLAVWLLVRRPQSSVELLPDSVLSESYVQPVGRSSEENRGGVVDTWARVVGRPTADEPKPGKSSFSSNEPFGR